MRCLYTAVWRMAHGERHLFDLQNEPLVHALETMRKTIRRDLHKMHAFLRFRRVTCPGGRDVFVAWFEPDHYILEATAEFFIDRFRSMAWSILTPIGSLHWDREHLVIGPAAKRADAPSHDAFEDGWNTYYQSTFNPARLNTQVMQAHMPKKYWRNMPETALIADLVRSAPSRVKDMIEREAVMQIKRNPDKAVAAMWESDVKTLADLNRIIAASEPLTQDETRADTRAVLGEGPIGAAIAIIGEQPGDQEDRQGRPFVGPAGQLLDRALADAGIDRKSTYLTNAVKHFKYEERGKRRIHQKPTAGEVKHHRWWLTKELDFVGPRVVVALGSTAVLALTGKALPVLSSRGPHQLDGRTGLITVHPSYLLRLPDEAAKQQGFAQFVADLKQAHALAA